MKTVILAGGMGSRISEESYLRPKPMVEIGEKPILWHILKIYSHFGFREFVICLGYKGYVIKEYFAHFFLHSSDVTFDFSNNRETICYQSPAAEPWRVTLADTGIETATGGRIKRVASYIGNEPFMLTYGDGVADIDIGRLLAFHRSHGKKATVTAVQPGGRFGAIELGDNDTVTGFKEKPKGDRSLINGGFFVLEPEVFDYISDDSTYFEKEPIEKLAAEGELKAYLHKGYWQPMDTLRDRQVLEQQWQSGRAPWKIWSAP
ncbi:MAG: glucose-1-phosphate cytidylyltransferase [Candidatus Eremiobacteraeota bacterium]|nr:glucose-1-phosphate cytidylyltransferase [Candidatus Eremiobacteraeota bacterium]